MIIILNLLNLKTILVHGGAFHPDDVCVVAFLKLCMNENRSLDIIRDYSPPSDSDAEAIGMLVADIGNGMFDHHAVPKETRQNGVAYAAFGKVVRAYWKESGLFKSESVYSRFDQNFIQELDEFDNEGPRVLKGVKQHLGYIISNFNPKWNEDNTPARQMVQFQKAVELAMSIIQNEIRTAESEILAEVIIKEKVSEAKHGILMLEEDIDYQSALEDTDINWVIMPSPRGGWNAISVLDSEGKNKALFPDKFRGRPATELQNICPGMLFCHSSGFMAQFENKDQACAAVGSI